MAPTVSSEAKLTHGKESGVWAVGSLDLGALDLTLVGEDRVALLIVARNVTVGELVVVGGDLGHCD